MSDVYIRTETNLPEGTPPIITVTPYHDCKIKVSLLPMIRVSDTTCITNLYHKPDRVPISTLQLCVEMDGDLYIWEEWKDL